MVKLLRILTMLCFGSGLFVQVTAQAAAPQSEPVRMPDCAQMEQVIPKQGKDIQGASSDHEGCCPDMTLGCLIAMNCVPPLALSGAEELFVAPYSLAPSYDATASGGLESEHPRPESPPPQSVLFV